MAKKISILIKALNEEDNIALAIESSLAAVAPYSGEVVIADSASTDKTVEIAKRYPVKIAILDNPEERCCGIGPELGYQHSEGEYVYILDGDMELQSDFIKKAVELLDGDPALGGVGGFVEEVRATNLEFRARQRKANRLRPRKLQDTECLSGGGLYRRKALQTVGYFSDRNLAAFEEYDAGIRLRQQGWRLIAIPDVSAKHYSHNLPTLEMLWHRLKSPKGQNRSGPTATSIFGQRLYARDVQRDKVNAPVRRPDRVVGSRNSCAIDFTKHYSRCRGSLLGSSCALRPYGLATRVIRISALFVHHLAYQCIWHDRRIFFPPTITVWSNQEHTD